MVASLVALAHFGRHYGFPKATPEWQLNATDDVTLPAPAPALTENRSNQQVLHDLKAELIDERRKVRDELVARASSSSGDAPLIDGEARLAAQLGEADTLLLQLTLSERVLEIDRLIKPLSDGLVKLHDELHEVEGDTAMMKVAQQYLSKNAVPLAFFRGLVVESRAMDAQLTARGGALGEGCREKLDGYKQLSDQFDNMREAVFCQNGQLC